MKLLFAAMSVVALLPAQPPTNVQISFEVASIKPTNSGSIGTRIMFGRGGHFTASGVTAKMILEQAYGVKDTQVADAPPWFGSEKYDIDAKPEDAVAAEIDKISLEQRRDKLNQLIQSLLAKRFKLELGHETKDLPVYALVIAKNGPKIQKSTMDRSNSGTSSGPGKLQIKAGDLDLLSNLLSRTAGRIVLNKTGLTGKYDCTLQWMPDQGAAGGPMKPDSDATLSSESGPSLFTAIQEQLGLKLESQKAPVDVLVIKHVEKPSEN